MSKAIKLLALLLAVFMFAAACGSDDDEATADAGDAPAAEPADESDDDAEPVEQTQGGDPADRVQSPVSSSRRPG